MKSAPAVHLPLPRGWRRVVSPLCLLVILPGLLIVGFAAQLVFAVAMSWTRALLVSVHHWLLPFLVVLLGWGVARSFPVERGRLAAAMPVARWVEYITPSPYIDELTAEPFVLDENGMLSIPQKPGLGVTLDPDAVARLSKP